jgi:pseudouridine 5'-phosphatase
LATSAFRPKYSFKIKHLSHLFSMFPDKRIVTGDDPRMKPGRGKPHGGTPRGHSLIVDIYLLALETINSSLPDGMKPIDPEECLVFEDAVSGVESGRNAGMQVAWVS